MPSEAFIDARMYTGRAPPEVSPRSLTPLITLVELKSYTHAKTDHPVVLSFNPGGEVCGRTELFGTA